MLGLGWGDYREVKILRHLGSSPLHRRVSKRIIHFWTKETPAWLWLRCEQVWVVIVCTVTSEQKGNLKMIDSGDLGGKILCWFHCLPTVLGNSIAEVVSDFNSWIFFFLPYFFPNDCHWQARMVPQACCPEVFFFPKMGAFNNSLNYWETSILQTSYNIWNAVVLSGETLAELLKSVCLTKYWVLTVTHAVVIGMQDCKLSSWEIIFSNVAIFEPDLKAVQWTISSTGQSYSIAY